MTDNIILTLKQAAELLQIHHKTMALLARAHKVPGKQVGHQWRFHRATLEKFIGAPDVVAMPSQSPKSRIVKLPKRRVKNRAPVRSLLAAPADSGAEAILRAAPAQAKS